MTLRRRRPSRTSTTSPTRSAIVPEHIWSTRRRGQGPGHVPRRRRRSAPGRSRSTRAARTTSPTRANTELLAAGPAVHRKGALPGLPDNDPANLDLANGKAQWGSQFIPGINKFYMAKDPDNHHTGSRRRSTSSCLQPEARRHRQARRSARRSPTASTGQQVATDRRGWPAAGRQPDRHRHADLRRLVRQVDRRREYDSSTRTRRSAALATAGYSPAQPAEARRHHHRAATPTGTPRSPRSSSSWQPIGIELTIHDLAQTTYNDQLYNGDFDLAYGCRDRRPGAVLRAAPAALLAEHRADRQARQPPTTSGTPTRRPTRCSTSTRRPTTPTQHTIINQLQQVMLNDVPVIPTTEAVDWYQYNTENITGWPTPDNPYAQPAAYNVPDWGRCCCTSRVEVVPLASNAVQGTTPSDLLSVDEIPATPLRVLRCSRCGQRSRSTSSSHGSCRATRRWR